MRTDASPRQLERRRSVHRSIVAVVMPRITWETSPLACAATHRPLDVLGLLSYLRAVRLLTVALKLDWRCIVVAPNRVAT